MREGDVVEGARKEMAMRAAELVEKGAKKSKKRTKEKRKKKGKEGRKKGRRKGTERPRKGNRGERTDASCKGERIV